MKRAVSERAIVLLVVLLGACHGSRTAPSDAPVADGGEASAPSESFDAVAVARAEDRRRAADIPVAVRTSHDVEARRRSARALARIADLASHEGLRAHLSDEDPETIAWAAYGLGYACKGHEDAFVRTLAARAASLPEGARSPSTRGSGELEPRHALARAIGRCGGSLSEQVLLGMLEAKGTWEEPAATGLGDLAVRRKSLGADAMTALVEAASRKESPLDRALYPLSRADAGDAFGKRVVEVARAALARPGDARIFAIKTLGRAPKELASDVAAQLLSVVKDRQGFTAPEQAEAARALGSLGEPGRAAAAEALAHLTPDGRDGVAIASLVGPSFHLLYTLIASVGEVPPKKAEPALAALSIIKPPSEPRPALARRLAELRCAAALGLARGAYEADVLQQCDAESSEISQRARLTALLRRPLTRARRAAFHRFAQSEHLRVRELAIEAISTHPELDDAAIPLLAEALKAKQGGLVAIAAQVLHAHPERALVLAASEKKAALDPRAPPPTTAPAQELAAPIKQALVAAINAKRPESSFETRIALVEAAASVHLPQAKHVATLACNDANPVVRERAQKALRALGEKVGACEAPDRETAPAAEIGAELRRPVRVTFTTDASEVAISLEPELSPVTATRIAALVRSGFYKGIVVHRVVPGFVVQFGDPDGDGYGGWETPLRCETAPVPFAALDVGMALAGRDTGSSQLFVTLSRTPHLDGEYTRVGRAEGDWAALAQGDVITDARIAE